MPIVSDTSEYTETVTVTPNGRTDSFVFKPGSIADNGIQIQAKAIAALAANTTYLAIAAPTNAQVVAQVDRITRECSALIRLLVGATDSLGGT